MSFAGSSHTCADTAERWSGHAYRVGTETSEPSFGIYAAYLQRN